MLIGDYNAQIYETNMASIRERYELRSLINEPTQSIMCRSISH